ncbi:MAG: protein-disulfide isomerase [Halothiobacillaceae bacterium]|nr:MAG: protein-disulfide isomerase [Halothiobacillaceae bacterium]
MAPADAADQPTASDDHAAIKKLVSTFSPGLQADAIEAVPLGQLYEVRVGADVFYVTQDAKFMLQGDLVDIDKRANITDKKRSVGRLDILGKVNERDMIIFPAEKPLHTVTVFTDIDCGYCRKLHAEMTQYNNKGITIRYVAFPRAGEGSESYFKAVSAWCSKDRQAALTAAKAGKPISKEIADCKDPVSAELELARTFGLSGTPSLILEDGTLVPGYVPADQLFEMLEKAKREATVSGS